MKTETLKGMTVAAICALAIGCAGAAVIWAGGISVEASGMKISLDLKSQTGAKVIFQRAD